MLFFLLFIIIIMYDVGTFIILCYSVHSVTNASTFRTSFLPLLVYSDVFSSALTHMSLLGRSTQLLHSNLHIVFFCFHLRHTPSPCLPSLWRSSLRWPVSCFMADLRQTTWTRPFTSTSCWPFSRGSMKNSPLSVRIRPAWKKRAQNECTTPP